MAHYSNSFKQKNDTNFDPARNIVIGVAELIYECHPRKGDGWHIPGRRFETNRDSAVLAAGQMNRLMGGQHGHA